MMFLRKIGLEHTTANFNTCLKVRKEICHLDFALGAFWPKWGNLEASSLADATFKVEKLGEGNSAGDMKLHPLARKISLTAAQHINLHLLSKTRFGDPKDYGLGLLHPLRGTENPSKFPKEYKNPSPNPTRKRRGKEAIPKIGGVPTTPGPNTNTSAEVS